MAKLYIGTSGFSYPHWGNGVFYPADLPKGEELEYYSQHFKTVELNSSFYHLPPAEIFEQWYKRTPDGFIFAVKANRTITHIKMLREVDAVWKNFILNAKTLKRKLGPILFQMPPGFIAENDKITRFSKFVDKISGEKNEGQEIRYAFEFRHPSWFQDKIYDILKDKNIALCITSSPSYPTSDEVTADFLYIRMHGGKALYSSKYSDDELSGLAKKILRSQELFSKENEDKELDVYVYFNNDAYGYAVENAKTLEEKIEEEKKKMEQENND